MSQQLKAERALLSPPGDDIQETLDHYKMSQAELAERMGRTNSKIHDIITGKEPITVSTALQLEKVLGRSAQYWLNREMLYREKLSRLEQHEALEVSIDWLKLQPIKELKQCGYIKAEKPNAAMVEEALQFYGVATPVQWHSIYVNDYATASFRKSESHQTTLGSMAAWLRIGELEMRKLSLPAYSKETFKTALNNIKELVRKHPADFAAQLQQQCAAAGVALLYTLCLPKAPVSGVTRWVGGNPLIQLTDRHKTNDHFWFTFYHEAGHVLLHGKKEVFFEEFEGYKPDKQKEEEANQFAAKILLPQKFTGDLPDRFTEKDVALIAEKYQTHTAIVVGRLQHLKMAPYSFGNKYKQQVKLFSK